MNAISDKELVDKELTDEEKQQAIAMTEVGSGSWGEERDDHFGYASEEERKAKRGLEDWELVEHIPLSQKGVPRWFIAVIVAVLLVAIGLSFPFWGHRPGYEHAWLDWGFGAAILYLIVFGTFVYFMVNKYSPSVDGSEEESTSKSSSKQSGGKGNTASRDSETMNSKGA